MVWGPVFILGQMQKILEDSGKGKLWEEEAKSGSGSWEGACRASGRIN